MLDFSVQPLTWQKMADMPLALAGNLVANTQEAEAIFIQGGNDMAGVDNDKILKYNISTGARSIAKLRIKKNVLSHKLS